VNQPASSRRRYRLRTSANRWDRPVRRAVRVSRPWRTPPRICRFCTGQHKASATNWHWADAGPSPLVTDNRRHEKWDDWKDGLDAQGNWPLRSALQEHNIRSPW